MAAADAAAAVMEAMVEADVVEWQRWSRRMHGGEELAGD
jgi:hypothetical protein